MGTDRFIPKRSDLIWSKTFAVNLSTIFCFVLKYFLPVHLFNDSIIFFVKLFVANISECAKWMQVYLLIVYIIISETHQLMHSRESFISVLIYLHQIPVYQKYHILNVFYFHSMYKYHIHCIYTCYYTHDT